jgi:hypothetical protein
MRPTALRQQNHQGKSLETDEGQDNDPGTRPGMGSFPSHAIETLRRIHHKSFKFEAFYL